MQQVLSLFVFIREKDTFAEYYREYMAKRLLSARSGAREEERAVVSKLKSLEGAQYTSRLEGMLHDMVLVQDLQSQYSETHPQVQCPHVALWRRMTILCSLLLLCMCIPRGFGPACLRALCDCPP